MILRWPIDEEVSRRGVPMHASELGINDDGKVMALCEWNSEGELRHKWFFVDALKRAA